jgi:hypothetical protein
LFGPGLRCIVRDKGLPSFSDYKSTSVEISCQNHAALPFYIKGIHYSFHQNKQLAFYHQVLKTLQQWKNRFFAEKHGFFIKLPLGPHMPFLLPQNLNFF